MSPTVKNLAGPLLAFSICLLGCNTSLNSLPPDAATSSDASIIPPDAGMSCTPESDAVFCAGLGANCGSITATDNCRAKRTASCGSCSAPTTCGGGGTANVCGCTRESDAIFCARQGVSCGSASGTDNCGASRTVASCGTCTSPQTCGGGGISGACGPNCVPETDPAFCSRLGAACGQMSGIDNCGMSRMVASCGTCASPQTCGGGGIANACGPTCVPETDAVLCASLAATCGSITTVDNCGVTRSVSSCGSCSAPQTCGGGGVANSCGCSSACRGDAGQGNSDAGLPDGGGFTDGGQIPDGGFTGPCSLAIYPVVVNFSSVSAGPTFQKRVTLTNVGGVACTVSSYALGAASDPGFSIGSGTTVPVSVPSGGSTSVSIAFQVAAIAAPYSRAGTLTIQSSDAVNPSVVIPLSAWLNQSVYAAGWPRWHHDNRNSGQSEVDTSALQGTIAWKFSVGTAGVSYINSPVVDPAGNVYQLGMSGTFYSISPSGTQNWTAVASAPTGDPHPSTPLLLNDGSIYLLSGNDGTPPNLYWLTTAGAITYSGPYGEDGFDACPLVGNDGTLFQGDDDGLAGSTTDPYTVTTFKRSGGTVIQSGGYLLAFTTLSERFGVAVADDGTSYWGNSGQFFAMSPPPTAGTFTPLAAWPAAGVTLSGVAAAVLATGSVTSDLALGRVNNLIYAYAAWETLSLTGAGTVQGVLEALQPADGSVAWTLTLPPASVSSVTATIADFGNAAPAVADEGTVYVGNGDGLRAVDGATGALKWLFASPNVTSSPAIGADGTIFYGAADGNLYAVKPDGTLRFTVKTGAQISSSPAIGPDGTVFVTSDDGYVYAIR